MKVPAHHSPRLLALAITLIFSGSLLTFVSWRTTWLSTKPSDRTLSPARPSSPTYHIEGVTPDQAARLTAALNDNFGPSSTQAPAGQADVVVSTTVGDPSFSLNLAPTAQAQALPSADIIKPQAHQLQVKSHLSSSQTESLKVALQTALQAPSQWSYLALGDVIPARDVYTYAKRSGFTYPYLKVADRVSQADLTVANLETTIADGQAFAEGAGVMNFTSPAQSLDGLTLSGIDGVNLANNHAMNGGATKVAEMLANLKAKNIGAFGVRANTSSPQTWSTTVKNIKITHLGFDTVPSNIEPTTTSPGTHRVALKPWGSLSQGDIAAIQDDVRTAKLSADVVIPWFHWGTEYTHEANAEQRQLAQACIDAGATAVIGTHPHWTQGIELYKGHPIAYSLGNFVFDQNWSEETKRSTALEFTFSGKDIVGATLLPAVIEHWVQPRFLAPSEKLYDQILHDIATHSWWTP